LSKVGLDRAEERGVEGGRGGRGGDATLAGRSLFEEEMVDAIVICEGDGDEGRGGGIGASRVGCFRGEMLILAARGGVASFFGGRGDRFSSACEKVARTGV